MMNKIIKGCSIIVNKIIKNIDNDPKNFRPKLRIEYDTNTEL